MDGLNIQRGNIYELNDGTKKLVLSVDHVHYLTNSDPIKRVWVCCVDSTGNLTDEMIGEFLEWVSTPYVAFIKCNPRLADKYDREVIGVSMRDIERKYYTRPVGRPRKIQDLPEVVPE
jgi:hypothetical protein